MSDQVMWLAPRALTTTVGSAPAVLVFKTDDFMNDLERLLDQPNGLADVTARPETWRDGRTGDFPAPTERPAPASPGPTKLYQPVHGRYYLVAAHLVCRRYGYPDRRMSNTENAGFVVRRMDGDAEYGWIIVDGVGRWVNLDEPWRFAVNEELLPMAPTAHEHRARRTRLLTGLIPVGAREKYEARSMTAVDATSGPTAVQMALRDTVVQPLLDLARGAGSLLAEERETLALAMVDLSDWLAATDKTLHTDYGNETAGGTLTWQDVLGDTVTNRPGVLDGTYSPLPATVDRAAIARLLGFAPADGDVPTDDDVPAETPLVQELESDLGSTTQIGAPADDPVTLESSGDAEYVFRTVYRRSDCAHERATWVSPPTDRFRFASFFDSDAPARPFRISLPIDTSPRGLRQFPRNVSVLVSDQLRRQMSRIDDEFEERGGMSFDIGMICSLSIPIITICALILLMIMVSILNIIFWWLPFFKICVPKLTVKTE